MVMMDDSGGHVEILALHRKNLKAKSVSELLSAVDSLTHSDLGLIAACDTLSKTCEKLIRVTGGNVTSSSASVPQTSDAMTSMGCLVETLHKNKDFRRLFRHESGGGHSSDEIFTEATSSVSTTAQGKRISPLTLTKKCMVNDIADLNANVLAHPSVSTEEATVKDIASSSKKEWTKPSSYRQKRFIADTTVLNTNPQENQAPPLVQKHAQLKLLQQEDELSSLAERSSHDGSNGKRSTHGNSSMNKTQQIQYRKSEGIMRRHRTPGSTRYKGRHILKRLNTSSARLNDSVEMLRRELAKIFNPSICIDQRADKHTSLNVTDSSRDCKEPDVEVGVSRCQNRFDQVHFSDDNVSLRLTGRSNTNPSSPTYPASGQSHLSGRVIEDAQPFTFSQVDSFVTSPPVLSAFSCSQRLDLSPRSAIKKVVRFS